MSGLLHDCLSRTCAGASATAVSATGGGTSLASVVSLAVACAGRLSLRCSVFGLGGFRNDEGFGNGSPKCGHIVMVVVVVVVVVAVVVVVIVVAVVAVVVVVIVAVVAVVVDVVVGGGGDVTIVNPYWSCY